MLSSYHFATRRLPLGRIETRRRMARSRIWNALQPRVQGLEDRIVLNDDTVTSTADSPSSVGTLTYEIGPAIADDDSNAQITFDLPSNVAT
jgi:hypothetical protein